MYRQFTGLELDDPGPVHVRVGGLVASVRQSKPRDHPNVARVAYDANAYYLDTLYEYGIYIAC